MVASCLLPFGMQSVSDSPHSNGFDVAERNGSYKQ